MIIKSCQKCLNHWRKLQQFLKSKFFIAGVLLALCGFLLMNTITLWWASSRPISAFLVLGGSVRREIYIAELAQKFPHIPMIISRGSPDPCLWLIFERAKSPKDQVLLEKCANSTFDNYYYTLPMLKKLRVHKVKVITSATHLPRAQWLAQIILGAHGIWAEMEIVPEMGIPGNNEQEFKTILDVIRAVIWAIFSQIIQPLCNDIILLSDVNIQSWYQQGFKCEHQAELDH